MGKQEVINYVMETPNNPNGAVLRTLLDGVEGGTNLPEVTSEDDGKVLTVVDGEWNKAEPSGGSSALMVGINVATMTLDKTWQEIYNAFPNVCMSTEQDGYVTKLLLTTVYNDEYGYTVVVEEESTPIGFLTKTADGYPSMPNQM